ncbi:MAG: ABC transporter ATP-binding protein [Candidatus Limnocylindrus sp.]
MSATPLLAIDSLDFSFGTRQILRGLSLRVERGEAVALLGANGSGKSTLLRLVAGLLEPAAGVITIGGSRPRAGRPEIGIAFQDARLAPWRSVARNVALPLELAGSDASLSRAAAASALERLGVAHLGDSDPTTLSGGERGRVSLARALVRKPELMLLDEPFAALDALTRDRFDDELPELVGGAALLLVTHDIDEALLAADRVLLLGASGRIESEAPGFRRLPATTRRSALAAPEGAAQRAALYSALRGAAKGAGAANG